MRVGSYEMQIVDQNGVALPEHYIGGRCYVEARAGQEFKVESIMHSITRGEYPVKSSVAILSIEGECLVHESYSTVDKGYSDRLIQTFAQFYDGKSSKWRALKFAAAPTCAVNKDDAESMTGEVRIEFFETKVSAARPVQDCPLPIPVTEHNKPYKQPSLLVRPVRVVDLAPPLPVCRWKRIRVKPDAVVKVKCHTARTINFLKLHHAQLLQAHTARNRNVTNSTTVTVDLTQGVEPTTDIKPTPVPIDVDADIPDPVSINVAPRTTVQQARPVHHAPILTILPILAS